MKTKNIKMLTLLAVAALSGSAFAIGLPAIPGAAAITGGGGGGGASTESIVKKYVGGTKSVLSADSNMLAALGLKEQADKAALQAKNLTEGATSDALEDTAKIQTENSKAIESKLTGEKVVMDAASKKQFGQGMIDLASGITQYVGMSSDLKSFKPDVTSIGGSAGSAIYIAKNLPTSITALGSALKRAMDFAKSNDIEIPKEAVSATALL